MTKEELYGQIQNVKARIRDAKDKKAELENKWDVLLEFAAKCDTKAEGFLLSIQRRKNKLFSIEGLLGRMKAAANYRQRMNEMLTGKDYQTAKGSIDELMESIRKHKSKLRLEIDDVCGEIERLKSRLRQLQYEYDSYPEEEKNDG